MPVSLRDWFNSNLQSMRTDPVRGLLHAGYTGYLGLWYTLSTRYEIGTNVLSDEWDLLIVLDACRVDVLKEVQDEYEFLERIDERISIGSHSREWLAKTFSREWLETIKETTMITGNGHTQAVFYDQKYPPKETVPVCWPKWDTVHGSQFRSIEQLGQYDHGEGYGVPPQPITDRTITAGREGNSDRIIAHYMQPHIPYIADALAENRSPTEDETKGWKRLETGELDSDTHWEMYKNNLRLVLDDVELLLENFDADRVCLTADHGNVFGEMATYGHPEGFPHPNVKQVPWVTLSATDTGSYEPTYTILEEAERSVEAQLQELGYM